MVTFSKDYRQMGSEPILPDVPLDPYHIVAVDYAPDAGSPDLPEVTGMNKSKQRESGPSSNPPRRGRSQSSGTAETFSSSRTALEHGAVRTLPMWIESFEREGPEQSRMESARQSPISPPQIHSAQHHYAPIKLERRVSQDGYVSDDNISDAAFAKLPERGLFGGSKVPERGRKWDHARVNDPQIVPAWVSEDRTSWVVKFARSSMYGPAEHEDKKRVDYEYLNSMTPGYQRPWRGDAEKDVEVGLIPSKKKRKIWYQRFQHLLIMHPLVPLAFRLVVLTTSIIALGLSASIFSLSHQYKFPQAPSTVMAIVVDVIAIPYIFYITWDEYTGKPLGLRSPKAKMRLLLLDLFFIIFESANAAIAFGALSNEKESCRIGNNGRNISICARVKTLCGFLLVALVAWSMTFTVSIFRLVERGDRTAQQYGCMDMPGEIVLMINLKWCLNDPMMCTTLLLISETKAHNIRHLRLTFWSADESEEKEEEARQAADEEERVEETTWEKING
ncbi:MAG: hypothetical protein M1818_006281 [Claussenomyces sp. TS43310]|nr:MAG: hypothetical protein M1818_006281 [Claussenomyces sp. TS43310]